MKKTIILLATICIITACKKAIKESDKKEPEPFEIHDSNYDKALSFFGKNNDSAFYYYNKMAREAKDSVYIAFAFNMMAQMQYDVGDYFGSQETSLSSQKFLSGKDVIDSGIISSNYNALGYSSTALKRYKQAINYFDLAISFNKDVPNGLVLENNKALAFQKLKDYPRAIEIFNGIIPQYKDDPKQYAKAISNLAKTKWLQNPNYNPIPEFLRALKIKTKENDSWGLNAAYAQLADYYLQKRPDSALQYAKKMYHVAKQLESPDDQIEALQKLITLSPAQQIKPYFLIYQKLNDSLQVSRDEAKNQFALVRYESEKLQKEITENKYQIFRKNIWLWSVSAFAIIAAVAGSFWYKKRKQRMEIESQNTIRENQLKTSKKVHDVVANGLYRVMTEVENQDDLDKNTLLDKIELLYEKSRDISYENFNSGDQNFHKKLTDLLHSFATETIKVELTGNLPELWAIVNEQTKYEVEHILQELMVNMRKHSKADKVIVTFEQNKDRINIYYADNGTGITKEQQFKNGLTNTGNRIKSIEGTINFESAGGKGLNINISFPVV